MEFIWLHKVFYASHGYEISQSESWLHAWWCCPREFEQMARETCDRHATPELRLGQCLWLERMRDGAQTLSMCGATQSSVYDFHTGAAMQPKRFACKGGTGDFHARSVRAQGRFTQVVSTFDSNSESVKANSRQSIRVLATCASMPTKATFTIVCFGLKRIKHQRQLSPS